MSDFNVCDIELSEEYHKDCTRLIAKVNELEADIVAISKMRDELVDELAKYESTPGRALKAVMGRHNIGFNGDRDGITISTIDGNLAETDFLGPCCGTFTITAEDIEKDG